MRPHSRRGRPTEVVARPDWRRTRIRRWWSGPVVVIGGAASAVVLGWLLHLLLGGIVVAAVLIGYEDALRVYLRVARLRVAGGRLYARNGIGRERSWPLTDIRQALLIGGSLRILGQDGRLLLLRDGLLWPEDELRALCRAATGNLTDVPSMSVAEQERRYPGSVTWTMRHPTAVQLMVGLPAIGVLVGFALLIYGGPLR